MGRSPSWRRVAFIPEITYFKPAGVPLRALREVCLTVDEAEAIRLKDAEGLEQEKCAQSMRISRTTFCRILESGRQKMADALLNGKAIRIEGGNFEAVQRRFRCGRDGHEWEVPFDESLDETIRRCPRCDTPDAQVIPPDERKFVRRGKGRGRDRQE